MSQAIENLNQAMKKAMAIRPAVGGFPYLAEVLRQAGIKKNIWSLPSCQSLYLTELGPIVSQMPPLISGTVDIPKFDKDALVAALRKDQAGKSTFPEFLASAWQAGVVSYEVDFNQRHVVYFGCLGEEYLEAYKGVELK